MTKCIIFSLIWGFSSAFWVSVHWIEVFCSQDLSHSLSSYGKKIIFNDKIHFFSDNGLVFEISQTKQNKKQKNKKTKNKKQKTKNKKTKNKKTKNKGKGLCDLIAVCSQRDLTLTVSPIKQDFCSRSVTKLHSVHRKIFWAWTGKENQTLRDLARWRSSFVGWIAWRIRSKRSF